MAQSFGAVTLPLGISFAKAAATEAQASLALRLEGAENFSLAGKGGAIGGKSRAEREKDEAEEALELFAWTAEEAERQRERDEWSKATHSFAGVNMTGAQWGELGDELRRDGPLRQWLISRMVRDGKTNGQATVKADEMADVFTALSKPPTQRTPEENAAIDRAKSDPDFQRYTSQAAVQKFGRSEINGGGMRHEQDGSTTSRAELFTTAPDLSSGYRAALAASEPLDAPKLAATTTPAPLPANSAGLDL
ncbi:MAG: hypothetical protein J7495_07235 [Sphingomonas sp.]|nr:hypothetical protein [Sphingomonas sp.]